MEYLRCESLVNPIGLDINKPRLGWVINSDRRGERQTAYQILVASTPELLAKDQGDLWDSGKVDSDQQNQVEYAGKPLESRLRCHWKVRIWDKDGKASEWSAPALWTMGLLPGENARADQSLWQAQWIGVEQHLEPKPEDRSLNEPKYLAIPRYLRKEFTVGSAIRRATAYATALGIYELRINGKKVGDHLLAPEWTDYRKRVQYQTCDVTAMLHPGDNVIGGILANGWYSGLWLDWPCGMRFWGDEPLLLVRLEIELADGQKIAVVSDVSWQGTFDGPIRFAGILEGETYDARKEMPGWDAPGFDAAGRWQAVKTVENPGAGKLVWQRNEPIRPLREIPPVAITEPQPGVYVFDFGQNMAGWCRFKFKGAAGDSVELQHGEILEQGRIDSKRLRVACKCKHHDSQLDRYTLKSDGEQIFEPRFTYHGFRYVELTGLKEKPTLESLIAINFNTDCPEVGEFACSNPLVNRLFQNIRWSQRSNYMGVPTDCPQRNERYGYTGDAQFFMRTAPYNMDIAGFFNKWLADVCQDSQYPGGAFADWAPYLRDRPDNPPPNIGWADAGIICPYEIYRVYGDTRIIREHYAPMKRYLDWLSRNSKDGLFTGPVGHGDWLCEKGGGALKEVIGTAYCAFDFRLMSEMAAVIGEKEDAAAFQEQAGKYAEAFAKAYIDAEGRIKESSQTGYALAFTMDLVPEALRAKMTERFADDIKRCDWHLDTGFIGTPRLLPGLHLAGRDDLAYRLLLAETSPSWLAMVKSGQTTMTEAWWGGSSLNHYAFGSVGEYLFGMVGGIQTDAPGYKRIRIQPVIQEGLTWAKTSYISINGKIATEWKADEGKLQLNVTIPPNTTATVYVPAGENALVTEGGQPADKAEGVKFLRWKSGASVYEVGSGNYEFLSTH
ncbi:MAG: glycoside hydrolase family 78 protein [Verrucomicrobiae bacterium]